MLSDNRPFDCRLQLGRPVLSCSSGPAHEPNWQGLAQAQNQGEISLCTRGQHQILAAHATWQRLWACQDCCLHAYSRLVAHVIVASSCAASVHCWTGSLAAAGQGAQFAPAESPRCDITWCVLPVITATCSLGTCIAADHSARKKTPQSAGLAWALHRKAHT